MQPQKLHKQENLPKNLEMDWLFFASQETHFMKYFESLGIFMPQGCAERRGNKITGSYGQFTRSKKTLSFIQFLPLNLVSPNIHINLPRLISIPLSWKDFIKIKAIPSCWSVILLEIVMMGLILWKIMSPSQEPL